MGLGALGLYFLGCLQKKKKKKIINQNFKFLEKIQDFQIFQKKKKKLSNSFKVKKRRKFSKRALGLGTLGSYFLGCFQKKNNNNHQSKFSIPWKNSRFQNFSKKKKNSKISIPSKIQVF